MSDVSLTRKLICFVPQEILTCQRDKFICISCLFFCFRVILVVL